MSFKKTLAGLTAFICICAAIPSEIISETVNFDSVYAVDTTAKSESKIIDSGYTYDGNWELTEDGTFRISDTSYIFNGTIPDEYRKNIKNVIIEDGTTHIKNSAFAGCFNLKSIVIPDSVISIENEAFFCCSSLESITIPKSVTSIESSAFLECNALKRVDYTAKTQNWNDILFGTNNDILKETEIHCTNGIINSQMPETTSTTTTTTTTKPTTSTTTTTTTTKPTTSTTTATTTTKPTTSTTTTTTKLITTTTTKPITTQTTVSFSGKGMEGDFYCEYSSNGIALSGYFGSSSSVSIPSTLNGYTVKYIRCIGGYNQWNGVKTINVSKGISFIDGAGNIVNAEEAATIMSQYDITLNVNGITIKPEESTNILKSGECGTNVNWELDLEGTLRIFGSGDMYGTFSEIRDNNLSDSIKNIVIEDGVKSIGELNYFKFLESIKIPDSVTSIGDKAFNGCTSLKSIAIPDSITSIGDSAFSGCTGLTSITIPDSVTSIGASAFAGCTGLQSITIPDNVTDIGIWTFSGCTGLTSITIPDSVTRICGGAFRGCAGLTSITIPDSVTSIDDGTFDSCTGLASITIPDSVTSIGNNAFGLCTSLKSITIPDSVTSIGDKAFNSCIGLISITIPDSITNIGGKVFNGCTSLKLIAIPDSVTSIGDKAFNGCTSLKSITIPESVTSIGRYAFGSCTGLTSITIPNSVISIGDYAFAECSGLISIKISDSVVNIGNSIFFSCKALESVELSQIAVNKFENIFTNCQSVIKSITLSDSVKSIGKESFAFCKNLTSITIPNSVTSIGSSAFNGCSSLESITIPQVVVNDFKKVFGECSTIKSIALSDNVTSIDKGAFISCDSFESVEVSDKNINYTSENGILFSKDKSELVQYPIGLKNQIYTIPNSVESIGIGAFFGCTYIEKVNIGNNIKNIGNFAFSMCTSLISITIPDNVKNIGEHAFFGCTCLKSLTIGKNVENIGNFAFSICTSLTSITIPNSVKSIGKAVFSNCTSLKSLTIGNSVESIGEYAFGSCTSIVSIIIPDNVTNIDKSVFKNCTSLESIIIGNGIKTISEYVFSGCESLYSVTIGNYVTKIEDYAFEDCINLMSIDIPGKITSISANTFSGCTSLESITIPNNVREIYTGAFKNCSNLTSIKFHDRISSIGKSTFYGCSSLKSVTLPDRIKYIESRTFKDCTELAEVTISNRIERIEDMAFDECENLSDVYYEGTEEQWQEISIGSFNESLTHATIHYGNIPKKPDITIGGKLSNSVEWEMDSEGTVTIFGKGSMEDFGVKNHVSPFYYEHKAKNIIIEDGIKNIGEGVFCGCDAKSIIIPKSVLSIGENAFRACFLTDVYYTGTEEEWNEISIIVNNEELTNATIHYDYVPDENPSEIPDDEEATSGSCGENVNWELDENGILRIFGKGDMYDFQFLRDVYAPWKEYKSEIKKIIVEDGVTSIGSQAFSDCINVTDVSLPESLRTIGHLSFDNCKALVSIEIPHGVYKIDYAFSNCSNLKYVVLPVSLKEIEKDTFSKCTNLKEVHYAGTEKQWEDFFNFSGVIPSGVKFIPNSIGADSLYQGNWTVAGTCGYGVNWAYYSTDNVLRIYGKGEMKNFGSSGEAPWRDYLNKIKIVTIESGVTRIGTSVFENCRNLTGVKIADTVTSIGAFAFNGCESLKAVGIPENIEFVDAYSFSGCSSLTYIEIPEKAKYIGDNAFEDCTSLIKIRMPESIISIGYASFNGCKSLKNIYYSGNSDQWKNIPKSELNESLNSVNFKFGKLTENEKNVQQLRIALHEYENAMNEYVREINKKTKAGYYATKKKKENYIEFMERDQASPERLLTFSFNTNDKEIQREVMEDAYEVLYDFLTTGIDKAINRGTLKLDIDDDKNIIEIEAGIVDNIYKLALEGGQSPAKGVGKNGYTVDLNITAGIFGVKFGSGYVTKDGRPYFVSHCTSMSTAKKIMNNYVDVLIDTAQDQIRKGYAELWDYFCQVTYISEATNLVTKEAVSNMTEFLMKEGYGNLIKDLIMVREAYDEIQEYLTDDDYNLMKKLNSKDDDELNLLFKSLKKGSVTDKEISDEAISRSLKKIDSLRKNAAEMFYNYVYGLEEYTEEDIFKMIIQCPVDVDIFDMDNNIVGYVHGTEISYNDDIRIQLSDDVKIISLPKNMNYSFVLNGTDEGTMNIMFKEIVDGEEVSYTNFYGIPLSTETSYKQNIENGEIKPVQDDNGAEIEVSEKMTSDNCEIVNIEVSGNYGGDITGSGDYVRGDSVLLTAKEYKNYSFAGWYDDEENLMSENNFFRFTALENEKVEARFEKVLHEVLNSEWEISEKYQGNSDFYAYNGDDNLVDLAFSIFEQQTDSTVMTVEIADSKFEVDTYDGINYTLENIEISNGDVVNIYDSENILVANMKLTDEKKLIPGDVNGDGEVKITDAVILHRYIAGGWNVEIDSSVADVDKNGVINIKDVVLLRRYIAGGWDVILK